jgi:hypothetical protein
MELFPKVSKYTEKLFKEPAYRSINLRGELEELLNGTQYSPGVGRWIVYRRYDLSKVTPDFYEPTGEAIRGGEKWEHKDEFIKTYSYYLRSGIGEQRAPMGVLSVPVVIFYVMYTVDPKPEDDMFEIPYTGVNVPAFIPEENYGKKYDIKQVEPKYGDSGRVEFYQLISWSDVT